MPERLFSPSPVSKALVTYFTACSTLGSHCYYPGLGGHLWTVFLLQQMGKGHLQKKTVLKAIFIVFIETQSKVLRKSLA